MPRGGRLSLPTRRGGPAVLERRAGGSEDEPLPVIRPIPPSQRPGAQQTPPRPMHPSERPQIGGSPFGPAMPEVWLISGIPGAGKTTVAGLLAGRLGRAAHIEGDRLAEWIVEGRVLPGEEPEDESERQMELCIRNQCLLARSYSEAGFVPVLDYAVVSGHKLHGYRAYLSGARLYFVVLAPDPQTALARDRAREEKQVAEQWLHLDGYMREQLTGVGLWLDTTTLTADETVDAILERREEALLRD